MKQWIFGILFIVSSANAHTLHFDTKSFQLDTQKHTSPALATIIGEQKFYGALYPGTAPASTMHLQYGSEYWLGQNCKPGTYSDDGLSACTDCGIEHYCTGGMHRARCKYGAIACPDITHSTDTSENSPINKFLSLNEVYQFVPETDSSAWHQISCCNTQYPAVSPSNSDALNNPDNACATGTIGPGAYLFMAYYPHSNKTDCISGAKNTFSNAYIILFDHPVSYASIHGNNVFQHFIDTEHPNYTKWTISSTPLSQWGRNENQTNILNIINLINSLDDKSNSALCVYELEMSGIPTPNI